MKAGGEEGKDFYYAVILRDKPVTAQGWSSRADPQLSYTGSKPNLLPVLPSLLRLLVPLSKHLLNLI